MLVRNIIGNKHLRFDAITHVEHEDGLNENLVGIRDNEYTGELTVITDVNYDLGEILLDDLPIHLQIEILEILEKGAFEEDGTSGQDRDNYTDTQDRDNYTSEEN
jgi:hypothetical protein